MRAATVQGCALVFFVVAACIGMFSAPARGAIGPIEPGGVGAEMRFPLSTSGWIGGDWSGLFRLSPRSDQADATLLRIVGPDSLSIRRVGGRWTVALDGSPAGFSISLPPGPLRTGEVAYLAVSYDSASSSLTVLWRDASLGSTTRQTLSQPGFQPSSSAQSSVVLFAGQTETALDAACDVVFRKHTLTLADFDLLWERQLVVDPIRGDIDSPEDSPIFQNMPGPTTLAATTPIIWAVGHAMTTLPRKAFGGAAPATAAVPGAPLTTTNSIVYDRTKSIAPTSFFVARAMTVISGLRYESPHGLLGGRAPTGVFTEPVAAAAVSPIFRAVARAEAPQGYRRVLFASNSRAVRSFDGVQRPGAIFAGFAEARVELMAGLASWRGDGIGRSPIPSRNASGSLMSAVNTNYTRACSYGQNLNPGPGSPALLSIAGSFIEMSFLEAPGSLYTDDRSVVVRALALRYPGSGSVRPRRVTQASPTALRAFVDEEGASLSTTALERTAVAVFERSLVVEGDLRGLVHEGWLASCVAGQGLAALNQIERIEFDGVNTTIGMRHRWDRFPVGGDTIAFGPFGYQWITTTHEAGVAPIRGLRLVHDEAQPGLPVCVVSWQTWSLGVNGYLFGGYGTSGAGFSSQLAEGFAGMHPALLEALGVDALGVLTANQDPQPEPHLDAMLSEFALVPGVEIALLGDLRFPQPEVPAAQFVEWHSGLRAQALSRGLVFATALEHPFVGSGWDAVAAGEMDDGAHANFDGNTRMARGLLDLLSQAALDSPPCTGDTNGDGQVNFADLNAVIALFGQAAPFGVGADLDGDGFVGFADLNIVLSAFGIPCD